MPRNITVTFADGSQHIYENAPDNITPEQATERAQRDFGKRVTALDGGRAAAGPKRTVADRYQPKPDNAFTSATDAAMRAVIPGDIIGRVGAAVGAPLYYALDHALGGPRSKMTLAQEYQDARQFEHAREAANDKAHPTVNAIAGAVGAMASPINKIAPAAGIGRVLVPAAIYGGIEGAGTAKGNAMQRLTAGVEGAASSAAGAFIGNRVVEGGGYLLAPKFTGAAKKLIDMGVRLTPGQMAGGLAKSAEDKLMSQPFLGQQIKAARAIGLQDWNRRIYNRVLEPIGQKYDGHEIGYEGINKIYGALSTAYNRILPRVNLPLRNEFGDAIFDTLRKAKQIPGDAAKALDSIVSDEVLGRFKNGVMSGNDFKAMESELTRLSRGLHRSQSVNERMMADRIDDILGAARDELEKANPQFAPALKKLNASFAAFTRVEKAAGQRATSGGVFTPSDLLQAAKSMASGPRRSSFSRGLALMQKEARTAQDVLPSSVGDTGTAGRLAALDLIKHPVAGLYGAAASFPYTSPGMALINRAARSTPGKTRNSLAKLLARSAPAAGNVGAYIGAQVVNGGN
ncbi:hypothetical protein ACLB0R_01260 [Sphingomonas sp. GlSt437]|uniref:hypothetical protein n=1 Tax=Sphingomonas sp. GlSt437 TaxID=3389970 RepID=UPI003A83D16E